MKPLPFGQLFRLFRPRPAAAPLPAAWRTLLARNLPAYPHLTEEQAGRLERHVQEFLARKRFEGCAGLEVTDEIRITVAAHACLMLAGRDGPVYPMLATVLVYPRSFVPDTKGLFGEEDEDGGGSRLGESWECGTIILSWRDIVERRRAAGLNVVYHECAHQLDLENGAMDGIPYLEHPGAWAEELEREYDDFCQKAERRGRNALDDYAATDPVEFFAVASEAFFETPRRLRAWRPALYDLLAGFYRLDPAAWE